jgi:hypothetical protein
MASTNAPDRPYKGGKVIKNSALKDQVKSGSGSTERDKPARKP